MAITSATPQVLDLTVFAGRYVDIYADQALLIKQVPSAATASNYAFSTSGAQPFVQPPIQAGAGSTSTADDITTVVGIRVPATTYKALFVTLENPKLLVQAQSTSTSYLEVVSSSRKVDV